MFSLKELMKQSILEILKLDKKKPLDPFAVKTGISLKGTKK